MSESVGIRPVFAFQYEENNGTYTHVGMNYRQWLIGMCISGYCPIHTDLKPGVKAHYAIEAADAIIAKLDEEKEG